MKGVVRNRLMQYVQNGDIAGGSILVRKGGEIVLEDYIGFSDIERAVPLKEDSVFRLASMTKPVVAAGIMLLAEEGKIRITDPVSGYLPAFETMRVSRKDENGEITTVPCERPLTIEDLLRHRSGIGHGAFSAAMGINSVKNGMTLDERVEYISSFPLDFQPGAESGYSARCAFDVLGKIIEIASGMKMEAFLEERFFKPLSMSDTTFYVSEAQKARSVRMYDKSSGTLRDSYKAGQYGSPFAFSYPCGSAGLSGTIMDYDRFVQMLSGHGKTILSDGTIRAMTVPDASLASNNGAWGLGMYVFNKKSVSGRALAQGAFGWSGAFGTHFYIDPVNDVTMILMVNRMDIGGSHSYVSFGMEEAVFEELGLREE